MTKSDIICMAYLTDYRGDDDVNLGLFSGCAIDDAIIPSFLESKIDRLFGPSVHRGLDGVDTFRGGHISSTLSLIYEDGTVRPWIREENPEDRAFLAEYGFHKCEIRYSHEESCDFYAGCRIQSPAKESRSVVVPAKYKDGETREMSAKIFARGAAKTYSISAGDNIIESYSLQRDAKKSKFWPVFAELAAYKPEAKK